MRLKSIILLFQLFWLFIMRRVLGRGLLATPISRVSALVFVIAAFAGFSVMSYVIIRQYFGGTGLLEPVLQVANVSVGFWSLIAYTLIRVLFMKADELLGLSFNLPVTNKERTLAFALFESSIVFLMTVFVFGAFSISTVLVEGLAYIPKVLASIWFPALSTYLLLSLGYYLLERALLAFRISRLRGLIVPLVLALGLAVVFPYTNEQSTQIAESYVDGRDYSSPALFYSKLQEDIGLWCSLLVLLASSAAIIPAVMAAAPANYVPVRRFFALLPSQLARYRFGTYMLVLFRSFETMVAVSFIAVYSIFAWIQHLALPPYALILITFQGIYAYSNSEPLRRMAVNPGRTLANYVCLAGSQGVLLIAVAIPVGAISAAQGVAWEASLPVAGFCFSNILISTLIGIAFPPEKGNPFTVLVGMVLTVIVVMIVMLGLNIFNFIPTVNVAILAAMNLLVAFYSILGMQRMERVARHEMAA